MIFSAASFLYLLPLAGLPVVFHFMLRQRKRPMVFSTLMFLKRTDPKLNARRKLQELLLLLLRALLILLLLLALSRPTIQTSGQSPRKVAALIVLDNSGSMSGSAALGRTRLYQAVEAVRALIHTLPDQARVGLRLTVPDPQVSVPPGLGQDHQSLLEVLDSLQPTEASARIKPVLEEAVQSLSECTGYSQVVHLFTDLQQHEWASLAQDLPAEHTDIAVVCHRIAPNAASQANVTVTQVALPPQRILPAHPYTAQVHLTNPSSVAASASLIILDSQGQRNTQQVSLGPGQNTTLDVPFLPTEPGLGWIKASIQSDGLDADNTALAAYQCQAAAKVLLVGQRTDYGFLSFALAPTALGEHTGIVTELCPAADLGQALQAHAPLLVAVTLDHLAGLPSALLRDYAASGGNVLIVPTQRGRQERSTLPLWLETEFDPFKATPADLVVLAKHAPFWTPILSERPEGMVAGLSTSGFYPVQCTGTSHALLGADYGNVILAVRDQGQGHVYICGMGLDGTWSNLPFSGLFVVLVHRMALWGSTHLPGDVQHLQAGDSLASLPFDPAQAQIVPLVGQTIHAQAGHAVTFARSGVYSLQSGDRAYGLAVSCAAAEGQASYLDTHDFPPLQSRSLQIVDLTANTDFARFHRAGARGLALFIPLLFLATLVALLEGLIAYPNGAGRDLGLGFLKKLSRPRTVATVQEDA